MILKEMEAIKALDGEFKAPCELKCGECDKLVCDTRSIHSMCIAALFRRVPQQPYFEHGAWNCKICGNTVDKEHSFCPFCGQVIEWGD